MGKVMKVMSESLMRAWRGEVTMIRAMVDKRANIIKMGGKAKCKTMRAKTTCNF